MRKALGSITSTNPSPPKRKKERKEKSEGEREELRWLVSKHAVPLPSWRSMFCS
jgi:hypothetical protein